MSVDVCWTDRLDILGLLLWSINGPIIALVNQFARTCPLVNDFLVIDGRDRNGEPLYSTGLDNIIHSYHKWWSLILLLV